ncbi:MAG TPA: hypothetical protein VNL14_11240 [Candidatus Acidoferrales bacterium]|nr:hypothetical protein [Candidatus Acidoferrales bacterium]
MPTIVFTGYLVRCPIGGFAWQAAHYLLGFRSLGYDTWFYEDTGELNCEFALNPVTGEFAPKYDYGIRAAANFLTSIGFGDRWVFVDHRRGIKYGPGAERVRALLAESDILVSLGPVNRFPPERPPGRPSVFIDLDPVYLQLKLANGDKSLAALLDAYSVHFTFGENIGNGAAALPAGGYTWRPTRQPVIIDLWAHAGPPRRGYTTVGKWNSQERDLSYAGQTFRWRKRTEWLRFLDLPAKTSASFEMAMDVDSVPGDRELLGAHGWRIVDPVSLSADPWRYRDYIRSSRAEFTVAKDMNVRLRSGWFSDRSACYLAAARPAVEQDTGFSGVLPLGPGLHAFNTLGEAADAVCAIESDYDAASAHASAVAREYFAADKVLRSLLSPVE